MRRKLVGISPAFRAVRMSFIRGKRREPIYRNGGSRLLVSTR
jgi:hypothetical protein